MRIAGRPTRRTIASAAALAVVVAVPVALAVIHRGFPASDVDLSAKDVWVTNGSAQLAGRLNSPIKELDGAVSASTADLDVVQNADDVFLLDPDGGSVQRIDPSYTLLSQKIEIGAGTDVAYGGERMAVLRERDGALWVLDASGRLAFDPHSAPAVRLGRGSAIAVAQDGTVVGVSGSRHRLVQVSPAGSVSWGASVRGSGFTVTAVGDQAVALGAGGAVTFFGGGTASVPKGSVLQQPGPDADGVLIGTRTGMTRVSTSGSEQEYRPTGMPEAASGVAAPVVLGECLNGAWTGASGYYLGVCSGRATTTRLAIDSASQLRFRVNRDVIALNDITTGTVWVPQNAKMVDVKAMWDQVRPPDASDEQKQTKTDQNQLPDFQQTTPPPRGVEHPPIARDDHLGARPGQATLLDVLANDSDVDGDVLTIVDTTYDGPGTMSIVEGGRALQFTPPADENDEFVFQYTISDGRGGTASANVTVTVHPQSKQSNSPPVARATSAVIVEQGQTVAYNVLADWTDPDGDELALTGASGSGGVQVRYSPDGLVTVTAVNVPTGDVVIPFTVSDGLAVTDGKLIVEVAAPGSTSPIATSDFGYGFAGRPIRVDVLANDQSPSGATLTVVRATAIDAGLVISKADQTGVTATAARPGSYYASYEVSAGGKSATGYIRFDVLAPTSAAKNPVAVTDVVYLRPNQTQTVPVLANDSSPTGAVLAVQSVSVTGAASKLTVQLISNTSVRITAPSTYTGQSSFSYTVSDGSGTATGQVIVVGVPELAHHQAPVAVGDVVTVARGDIATVDVLANDYHPDGSTMYLSPTLTDVSIGDGTAFVSGERLRLQAPSTAGTYSLRYTVTDDFQNSDWATVTINVTAPDRKTTVPPIPLALTARAIQGNPVTIPVPLDGIDPDGESVRLTGSGGAQLGTATVSGSSIVYTPFSSSTGTDRFTYTVENAFGVSATGEVAVGVIAATSIQPPVAPPLTVSIRPGRTASLDVLALATDPQGSALTLEGLVKGSVQSGIEAKAAGRLLEVTAGSRVGTYSLQYRIANRYHSRANGSVIVKVDPNAVVQPPTAIDQVVPDDQAARATAKVSPRTGAVNPGGTTDELKVAIPKSEDSTAATLHADGTVTVDLDPDRRLAIPYTLTDTRDGLTSTAFIVVPRRTDSVPPRLRSGLDLDVPMNGSQEWSLGDLVVSPSGGTLRLVEPNTAGATHQKPGTVTADGSDRLRFVPATGYLGAATMTFQVTDTGHDADAVTFTVPVTVGAKDKSDQPPVFADQTLSIEEGSTATQTVNLRDFSSHPNPSFVGDFTYALTGVSGSSDVTISVNGSTLSYSVDADARQGQSATATIQVRFRDFTITGHVTVAVIATTAPPPQAFDITEAHARASSTYTETIADHSYDPFPGTPLTVTQASFSGDPLGATVSHSSGVVTIQTGTAKSGTVSVIYTVADKVGRTAQGLITLNVESAPEPVTSISLTNPSSGVIDVVFQPPVSSNGAAITGYTVTMSGQPGTATRTDCSAGATCEFTGRTNGQLQSVTVAATNEVGTTTSSPATITPFGVPSAPPNATVDVATNSNLTATITPRWSASTDAQGAQVHYVWQWTQGTSGSGQTTGTSGPASTVGAGNYAFQVQACNQVNVCSPSTTGSGTVSFPAPSGTLYNTGVTYKPGDGNTYYYLGLSYQYLPGGTYSVDCFASGTKGGAAWKTYSQTFSAGAANVQTSCYGTNDTGTGWFKVRVYGNGVDFSTPETDPLP